METTAMGEEETGAAPIDLEAEVAEDLERRARAIRRLEDAGFAQRTEEDARLRAREEREAVRQRIRARTQAPGGSTAKEIQAHAWAEREARGEYRAVKTPPEPPAPWLRIHLGREFWDFRLPRPEEWRHQISFDAALGELRAVHEFDRQIARFPAKKSLRDLRDSGWRAFLEAMAALTGKAPPPPLVPPLSEEEQEAKKEARRIRLLEAGERLQRERELWLKKERARRSLIGKVEGRPVEEAPPPDTGQQQL